MKNKNIAVSTLMGLSTGVIYTTTNYSILKVLKGNRGSECGSLKSKVNSYVKLIKSGMFFEGTSPIIINVKGWVLDGANRLKALQICAKPVEFIITSDEKLNNCTKSEFLDAIAFYNDVNTTWTGGQSFESALISKAPLAIAIDKTKAKMVAEYHITKKDITPAQLYAIVAKQKARGKKNRTNYKDKELVKEIKTERFEKDIKFVSRLIQYLKPTAMRPSDVVNQVMPLIWDNEIDRNRFYHNLLKHGFENTANVAKEIKPKVLELANKRIKRDAELTAWDY